MKIKLFSVFLFLCLAVFGLSACADQANKTPRSEGLENKDPNGIVQGEIMVSLKDLGDGKFQYQLKNQTEKEKTFEFSSSQRFDYALKTEDGNQIYLFSSVALYLNEKGIETLKPGEELNYDFDLSELGLEKGKYLLEVWLTPSNDKDYKVVMDYYVE